jgi:putative MATE family efflux protein
LEIFVEKNLYKLTWPIFVELLFFILMGSLDTLMLSQYSDRAVAAVGITNQMIGLFGIFLNIVATGTTVVVSQFLGASKDKEAKGAIKSGFVLNSIIGVIAFGGLFFLGEGILRLINTDASLMGFAMQYLRWAAFSLIFFSMGQAVAAGFRAYGKPRYVMYVTIVANVLNVLLNYILIFGNFGAPALGVLGAAYATVFSRLFIFVVLAFLMIKVLGIRIYRLEYSSVYAKRILHIGIPSGTENVLWNISQIILISFVNTMGLDALIARTYVITIMQMVLLFSLSLANANAIIIGYHVGEQTLEEAYERTFKTMRIALGSVIAATVTINLFAIPILSLFTNNSDVLRLGQQLMLISLANEIGRTLNLLFIFSLRSANDTVFPVIMGVISMYGISVLMGYVLGVALGFGVVGIFMAMSMDELFRGAFMSIRWKRKTWHKYAVSSGGI